MSDTERQAAAEDAIGEMIFPDDPIEEKAERNVKPVVEGDDEETDEVSEDESEDESEGESEDDTPAEEMSEIEIDGQMYEVPPHLKEAFMRNSDYTQKTQAVAAQRKEIELQSEMVRDRSTKFEFAESIQKDMMDVEQAKTQIKQYEEYLSNNVRDMTSQDIAVMQVEIKKLESAHNDKLDSLKTKYNEFQQAQKQSHEELLTKGTEILRQKVPGWGEKHQKQVRDFALKSGYSEADISSVVDPRQVETLWKASQYDALKSGSKAAVKTVQGAPTIQPKARKAMSEKTKQDLNLRKVLKSTKSAQDKASAIGDTLAGRFGM